MLRRYVIANGISTAVLYGAAWSLFPVVHGFVASAEKSFDLYAFDNTLIGPLLHGVVSLVSGL